jgi:hypothetical protein
MYKLQTQIAWMVQNFHLWFESMGLWSVFCYIHDATGHWEKKSKMFENFQVVKKNKYTEEQRDENVQLTREFSLVQTDF